MGNEDKTNQKKGQRPAASGWIRTVQAKMDGPSLEDNRADAEIISGKWKRCSILWWYLQGRLPRERISR